MQKESKNLCVCGFAWAKNERVWVGVDVDGQKEFKSVCGCGCG